MVATSEDRDFRRAIELQCLELIAQPPNRWMGLTAKMLGG